MLKIYNKMRFTPLLLTLLLVVIMAVPAMPAKIMAAPLPAKVSLLSTSNFAVLAGTAITNTGDTTISGDAGGDIGLSPGTSFTPGSDVFSISGTKHLNDSVAGLAQTDLITAYNEAASRATNTPITAALGGGQTLYTGTYTSANSIQINGDLTLDAQGDPDAVFIFQAGSTLTTASNSRIILVNGARYCRIFWQVGNSATLGTNATFVGHIFAMQSITVNSGAKVQGQLLARNGTVSLDNNTITNGFCGAPATLHVIKHVINDDGLTAVAANFNLHVKISGSDVAKSPAPGFESPGATYSLAAGTYVVSEDAYAGYAVSYSGDSDASGNITLASGDNKTVTVTNYDNPPLIHVTKTPVPLALTAGPGSVTYTYKVSNPGKVALSNVNITDDKFIVLNYISGDVNGDSQLQPNETWIYTGRTTLNITTTNTATVEGSANGITATDSASATVVVTPVRTVTGGQLPSTSESSPLYVLLLFGIAITLIGALGWRRRNRYE